MDRANRLKAEDRPEFERVLDEAIGSEEIESLLDAPETRLDARRLRARALRATDSVAAPAAPEYRAYLARRRPRPARSGIPRRRHPDEPHTPWTARAVLQALGAIVPSLAAVAALVFLAGGYGLRILSEPPPLADGLVTAGWTTLVVALVALLAALVGVAVGALRNRPLHRHGPVSPEAAQAEEEAREAWLTALRDRGVLPYLRKQLKPGGGPRANSGDAPARPAPSADVPLPPQRGSGTTETEDAGTEEGPGYAAPDFSSPDFATPGFRSPRSAPGESERTSD